MRIKISGTPKEIAALVTALQGQRFQDIKVDPAAFVQAIGDKGPKAPTK